jgi:hypothetical protein
MIGLIDEQIRTSIPPELVERVKKAKEAMLFYSDTALSLKCGAVGRQEARPIECYQVPAQQYSPKGKNERLVSSFDTQIVGSAKDIYEIWDNLPQPLAGM